MVSTVAQSLEITQKVAFNIASETSYVYILREQKFIKNAKMKPETCGQNVLPESSFLSDKNW